MASKVTTDWGIPVQNRQHRNYLADMKYDIFASHPSVLKALEAGEKAAAAARDVHHERSRVVVIDPATSSSTAAGERGVGGAMTATGSTSAHTLTQNSLHFKNVGGRGDLGSPIRNNNNNSSSSSSSGSSIGDDQSFNDEDALSPNNNNNNNNNKRSNKKDYITAAADGTGTVAKVSHIQIEQRHAFSLVHVHRESMTGPVQGVGLRRLLKCYLRLCGTMRSCNDAKEAVAAQLKCAFISLFKR